MAQSDNKNDKYLNLFDDEATDDPLDDMDFSDEITNKSNVDQLNSSDIDDDRTDEYDYSDSFIDDGSLVSDTSYGNSDDSKSED